MKKIIIGATCFFTLMGCSPEETVQVEIVPAIQKSLNDGYQEEFLPKKTFIKPKVKVTGQEKTKKVLAKKTVAKLPIKKKNEPKKVKPKRVELKKIESKKTTASIKKISFKLSFYTTLPEHNGGYTVTALGENLVGLKNAVASNYYPLGTKIYLEGFGTVQVVDRGGSNFDSSTRLDVLVQRRSGESNTEYTKRVWNMGLQTVEGYIVKP